MADRINFHYLKKYNNLMLQIILSLFLRSLLFGKKDVTLISSKIIIQKVK